MSGFLSRVTIRSKLLMAFAIVVCGVLGLGLFATQRLSGLNAAAADMRGDWLPAVHALGDLGRLAEQLRVAQQLRTIAPSAEDDVAFASLIEQRANRIQKNFTNYNATAELDAPQFHVIERPVTDNLSKSCNSYLKLSRTFDTLLLCDNIEEARRFSLDRMRAKMARTNASFGTRKQIYQEQIT